MLVLTKKNCCPQFELESIKKCLVFFFFFFFNQGSMSFAATTCIAVAFLKLATAAAKNVCLYFSFFYCGLIFKLLRVSSLFRQHHMLHHETSRSPQPHDPFTKTSSIIHCLVFISLFCITLHPMSSISPFLLLAN